MTVTIGDEGFSFCASLWKCSHLYYYYYTISHISHHLYLILFVSLFLFLLHLCLSFTFYLLCFSFVKHLVPLFIKMLYT